jgi:hypothetical protein
MLWVTWRQHRAELLVAVLLLVVVAVPLIITGLALHAEYATDGVQACVREPAERNGCALIVDQFVSRHTEWGNRLIWVAFLPALAGVFVGAPLLAREFEQATWRLAFTQSVTRTRWLATKLGLVGGGVAVVAGAFAALFTWWRAPLDEIGGRLHSASFIIAPPSLVSVTLFAFAVGVFAGVVLRRTIAAMAATLAGFGAIRIAMEEYVRPHYRAPLVRITEPAVSPGPQWPPVTDWTVDDGWIDAAGRRLSDREETAIIREIFGGERPVPRSGAVEQYLAEHGLRHYTEYLPNSTFWSLQAIESLWFLGFTAVLLGGSMWILRRRTT